ncbi:EAL domain-containing protein [Sporomusa malonica]|uniref:Diguanylate phosphodiesterase n=1 Tax=Sporomusa malonica TaxID=112901 RepID=A0A1W2EL88_9FIRM|nr:EAL domain-containing protein [Sporomusa malonica]SMD10489.1 diguanylate phosphodiesterase [Sporomusa malonica]
MHRLMNVMEIADNIANQRHVEAMRRGVLLTMPLVVIGAFSTMMANVSVMWYQQMMIFCFGPNWTVLWQAIASASLNGISILLVFSVSYFLAEKHEQVRFGQLHPLIIALVSFACLMMLMQPFTHGEIKGLPFIWTGLGGIFFAVVTALTSTELFLWLFSIKKNTIRLFADVADPILSQALACIFPATGTIFAFALIKMGAADVNVQDIHMHFYAQVESLFQNIQNPLGEIIVFNLLVHLLWFFGLHGNSIMEPVLQHIQLTDIQAAGKLAGAGDQAGSALTKTFFDAFVLIGGSGSTVCLMLALFLVSRRGNMAWLAKLSIVPALFNINELLIFGLPIVLNPIFLIPFVLVPAVLACVSYLAISMGLVSMVVQSVHWTTPPLLSGYIATNSWSGAGLQLLEVAIGAIIYLPFVIINEKQKTREISKAFDILVEETQTAAPQFRKQLLIRRDGVGTLARLLVHDLKSALANGEFFLEYQPQVNQCNRVVGVEALLRWSHKLYGRVPPLLTVVVAEEAGLIQSIGKLVIDTACHQLCKWKSIGVDGIRMSINVSAIQLQDQSFADNILVTIRANALQPQDIEIEITESIALNDDARTNYNLTKMRQAGIRIAIDDFGMGHTSLRYIKHFPVDTLKIDGMLSRDVIQDKNCQEIITSIVSLCSSLKIDTIVEYVETQEQRDILRKLGCMQYQGYYYSQPLSSSQLADYVLGQNTPDSCDVADVSN